RTMSVARVASDTASQALHDANHITSTQITEGAIETPHLAANSITSDKIGAGAIDGQVITGATIRTAATGERIELTTTNFVGYGPSGPAWMRLNQNGLRTYYRNTETLAQYLTTRGSGWESGLWGYRPDGS